MTVALFPRPGRQKCKDGQWIGGQVIQSKSFLDTQDTEDTENQSCEN